MTVYAVVSTEAAQESIAHLDFDVETGTGTGTETTPSFPCAGWRVVRGGKAVAGNDFRCDRPAVLRATYGCCGTITHFCLDCYNGTCSEAANDKYDVLHGKHRVSIPAFGEVVWL